MKTLGKPYENLMKTLGKPRKTPGKFPPTAGPLEAAPRQAERSRGELGEPPAQKNPRSCQGACFFFSGGGGGGGERGKKRPAESFLFFWGGEEVGGREVVCKSPLLPSLEQELSLLIVNV